MSDVFTSLEPDDQDSLRKFLTTRSLTDRRIAYVDLSQRTKLFALLSDEQRTACHYRYAESMVDADIARAMNIAVGSIIGIIVGGRRILRALLPIEGAQTDEGETSSEAA